MNKTKIEWADYTWNPVTGCLHGCEYCYARELAKTRMKNIYTNGFEPTFWENRLDDPKKVTNPSNVFVCSMADLFGEWVPDKRIREVFKACEAAPQHRYLFLTKNMGRYDTLDRYHDVMQQKNMWFGATVTNQREMDRYCDFPYCCNRFLSIEPILGKIINILGKRSGGTRIRRNIDWVIIGAETGSRKGKIIPQREWVENIVSECQYANIPVFMKNSLVDIWGEPLIQEYPWSRSATS